MDKQEKMFALVEQWKKSGMTRNEFVDKHDISIDSFAYWRRKHSRKTIKDKNPKSFIEITPKPIAIKTDRPKIDIELPDGTLIKIY